MTRPGWSLLSGHRFRAPHARWGEWVQGLLGPDDLTIRLHRGLAGQLPPHPYPPLGHRRLGQVLANRLVPPRRPPS